MRNETATYVKSAVYILHRVSTDRETSRELIIRFALDLQELAKFLMSTFPRCALTPEGVVSYASSRRMITGSYDEEQYVTSLQPLTVPSAGNSIELAQKLTRSEKMG